MICLCQHSEHTRGSGRSFRFSVTGGAAGEKERAKSARRTPEPIFPGRFGGHGKRVDELAAPKKTVHLRTGQGPAVSSGGGAR